jgi:prepilin-type processing-associated H-X9-DG protein
MSCGNHLKQWALGIHNYHDTLGTMPPHGVRFYNNDAYAISWMVLLLSFVEQQGIQSMMAEGGTAASVDGTTNYNPGVTNYYPGTAGPAGTTYDVNYRPWTLKFPIRVCPSDSNNDRPVESSRPGVSSYRACQGDYGCDWVNEVPSGLALTNPFVRLRGAFRRDEGRSFGEITDGTSNTVALSEALIFAGDRKARSSITYGGSGGNGTPDWCLSALDPADRQRIKNYGGWAVADFFGNRWPDASEAAYAAFHTVMAPNTVSCITWGTNYRNASIVSASSNHTGGVNVAFVDGSVRFISNTINTGLSNIPAWNANPVEAQSKSAYGVWGALGTIDMGEAVSAP